MAAGVNPVVPVVVDPVVATELVVPVVLNPVVVEPGEIY
jgi:hypothetical protein